MIGRRTFLGGLATGVVAAGWAGRATAFAGTFSWPLGVQLYSVKDELDADFDGTLRQVAALGYREVETAGLHGRSAASFRRSLDAVGLRAVSAHYPMGDLLADPRGAIAAARALGADWLVCSSPRPDRPLPPGDWIPSIHAAMTLAAWRTNATALQRLGGFARDAGLQFGYHNHPVEFARYDGQRGMDVLLENTDPALVKLELDVAWAVAGGVDPVAFITAHADRVRMLHVKGLKHRPPLGQFGTDFATGVVGRDDVIDWPAVFAAAKQAGVVHAFVEQEPPHVQPALGALALCRDYLTRL